MPIELLELENRPKVLCQPDKRTPVAVVRLSLLAGSKHENPKLRGVAHLCEHLVWQGDNRASGSFLELIHGAGGSTNGWTLHDQTRFAEAVPCRQLSLALWIEAQRLSWDVGGIAADWLEKERETLIQEWNERANHPYLRELESLQRLLYSPDHAYHYPAGGLPEGIRTITGADVDEYLRACYRPERAVLAVVGDISPEEVARYIEALFIPRRPASIPPRQPEPEPVQGEQRAVFTAPIPYVRTYLAYRAPGRGEEAWHATELLARSLATGRSNPLYRQLVEAEGLAYEIRLHIEPMQEASTVAFVATAAAGTPHEKLEAALIEAVDRALSGELKEAQIERARKAALIEYYSNVQNLGTRADRLASAVLFARDGHTFGQERERLERVAFANVMNTARKLLIPERRAILSLVPLRSAS